MKYDTGQDSWNYNQPIGNFEYWLLGPCPICGDRTRTYGGSYSCFNENCEKSAYNYLINPGPIPDWWGKNIQIKLDGDTWMAHGENFVNLQESEVGFGNTPAKAVENFRLKINE